MKRRKIKKVVNRSAYHVVLKLKEFLLDPEEDRTLQSLNCALVSLISAHMELDFPERARMWWADDVEWTERSQSDTQVTGTGKIWWGLRSRPSGEMRSTNFV